MVEPYCGAAPLPAELLSRWNFDPALLAVMGGAGLLHMGALLRDEAPLGQNRRAVLAATGWALLVVLLVSPLCALTSALFSVRVAHHVVLVAGVAPLLALSLPRDLRVTWIGRAAGAAFIIHMVLLWFWHAPAPYAAALADPRIFWAMELSLLGSAMLLWMAVLSPAARLGAALAMLLGSVVQMGLLGAVITFARTPLYAAHLGVTAPWGLSALQDQQLAGLIMWVPASIPYLAAALALVASRLGRPVTADESVR
uniref:Cytochrome c oxidase assembly protein n=1 Tax=Rhodopseudomonas palustris (strain BisA53) TaxID=316055 RepID=Q07JU3_RHOP5